MMDSVAPLAGRLTSPRHWRRDVMFVLLLSYFGLYGASVGAQGVLWADLFQALHISQAAFGSAQLVAPLVSVGLLLLSGQLSAFVGKKLLICLSLLLFTAAFSALAYAHSLSRFVIALLLSGSGIGLLEMAMNATTLDWESATGRPVMNLMHAGFSAGAVLGAVASALLLRSGWSYGAVLLALGSLCGVALLATLPAHYPPVDRRGTACPGIGATLHLLLSRRSLVVAALLP